MNCFYHPETTAVGTCNQCGKGACRDCVQDIGGALLCSSCVEVLQEELEAETQADEREKEESLQGFRSRLRWSWIIGCSCAVLALLVASPAQMSASVHQGQASSVTLAFGLFLGSLVSGYVFWSLYWGIPAVWSWGRKLINNVGCFVVANPFAWLIIVVFLFWVPLMLGVYYGVLGGAIYQYFKYRRRAEVGLTRRKLVLSAAFVGLLAVGSAVSLALAPNVIVPRQTLLGTADVGGEVTTPSGLKYVDQVVGTGKSPSPEKRVSIHYTGTLMDGTEFDSSLDRGRPFEFRIGTGAVIKGWDEGVMTMKVGGKRKLIIPASLGFGRSGSPPRIPPNATLIFEVELLSVR